jgi:hypothetical protein
MTGPEYDAELEAFLKRRSMMHRRLSDIDHAEPSVELDRLVLNRAREAIETPAQPLYRTSRWALPIGLAAAILIAFTVVLNLDHHGAKSNSSPAAAAAAPQAPAPAVARAASAREQERIEQQRVVSDSIAIARRAAQTEKSNALAAESAAKGSTPLVASTGAAVSPGVLAAPTPPAAAPPPAAASVTPPHSSPDAWLREINRLRAAGETAEADRELTAFREAYPRHPAYSVAKPPTR